MLVLTLEQLVENFYSFVLNNNKKLDAVFFSHCDDIFRIQPINNICFPLVLSWYYLSNALLSINSLVLCTVAYRRKKLTPNEL
jgi:hypothetical protein